MSIRIACLLLLSTVACGDSDDPAAPDAADVDQADAAHLATCDSAQETYVGPFDSFARDVDADSQTHHLSLVALLNQDELPDELRIKAYHQEGIETGTFALPHLRWIVTLCADAPGDGSCTQTFDVLSGTLEITSIAGRMTGSATDLTFTDDRVTPTCVSSVEDFRFDEQIAYPPP